MHGLSGLPVEVEEAKTGVIGERLMLVLLDRLPAVAIFSRCWLERRKGWSVQCQYSKKKKVFRDSVFSRREISTETRYISYLDMLDEVQSTDCAVSIIQRGYCNKK
jgi:hypothetical protein